MEILKNDRLLAHIIKEYGVADFFEEIERYRPGLKLIRFPKNTYLYSRPEHRKYAYFLVAGKLRVSATAENGDQMLVRYCDGFIFIGDMELLGYEEPANMTETVTECLLLALDISLMKEVLMQDKKFLRFLCDNLAEKISYFAKIQFRNHVNSPRQKIAIHILEAARKRTVSGEHAQEIICFKENLRRTAELLDVSYRHLHRILGEFVDSGLLRRNDCGYEVSDLAALQEIANGNVESETLRSHC